MRFRFDWYLVKRATRFWWQRQTRGWDDSETWALEHTIAKFIAPRLKSFKELNCGVPGGVFSGTIEEQSERWNEVLDQMIFAFEFVADEDRYFGPFDKEENRRVEKGLDLFREYFRSLWW